MICRKTLKDESRTYVVFCYGNRVHIFTAMYLLEVLLYMTSSLNKYFQIEHAQHLVQGTTARFGQQGIIASVQVCRTSAIIQLLLEILINCLFIILFL